MVCNVGESMIYMVNVVIKFIIEVVFFYLIFKFIVGIVECVGKC